MSKVEDGTQVKVHYTGKLNDGTVFDSSQDKEPLEFTMGKGEVIPGIEDAVRDMDEGESKQVTIGKDQAYGDRRDDMIIDVPKDKFPDEIPQNVGQQLMLKHPEGQEFPAVIVEVKDETVTLDANHPLAGEDLNFEIQRV
ncbi:peptidylprolyl isomerase FKBP-type [Desulfonatronospira thiodismutans ASO3-1]|uniref:Peptidyl-prolyl cis-trans isomerase n=1 Tax=Desulfonatronospira thiodismutans ASO3-1 TaxID=555779 RepID=D6SR72_9BACT|nr:peptidylprolyl isomerase [Desulfonatronospira thiodismutans]EFI33188.1 peptidylprolyl isomerase FKBP-type [Desulfonatronospira thiodismutans ASO3-1]